MAELNDSILDSTKKALGLDTEYDAFDPEIIMHINSTFFTLQQLGVGPTNGFMIVDNTALWSEFMGVEMIHAVKSFVALKVRLIFDPPATSFVLDAMNKTAEEYAWRLNAHMEGVRWRESKITEITP